jgi:hypothetical protein
MHIDINDKTVLKEIQKTFSDYYPFLLMKFYKKPHNKYEESRKTEELDIEKTVGDILKKQMAIKIEMLPKERVSNLENEFQNKIGIPIQILKLENGIWCQTSGLDNLTLKDLNILGRNSSDDFVMKDVDDDFETEEEI